MITLAAHAPALMAQVRGEAVSAEVVAELTPLEYMVRATERQAVFGITILSEKGGRTRRDFLLGRR